MRPNSKTFILPLLINLLFFLVFSQSTWALEWDTLDADFIPHYTDSKKVSIFNYPLADFSARVAAESYNSGDSKGSCSKLVCSSQSYYDCALSRAGFENIQLLHSAQATMSYIELGLIVKASGEANSDISELRKLARNSLQALVGYKWARVNGENRRIIVIAFRGTEFGKSPDFGYDLATDLAAGKMRYNSEDPNNLVHEGFMTSEWVMENELENTYRFPTGETLSDVIGNAASSNDLFLVTGHSLGGAVATLYSARLIDRGVKRDQLSVYTFGAPSVGNANFRNVFFNEESSPSEEALSKKLNLHRVRNKDDLIPYLAYFEFLTKYYSEDIFDVLKFKEKAAAAATEFVWRYAFSSWPYVHVGYPTVYSMGSDVSASFSEGTVSLSDRINLSGQPLASFPDHNMGLYLANIRSINPPRPYAEIPKLSASPKSGDTYGAKVSVTLTSNEPGAIYYTVDGLQPDASDVGYTRLYTGPIEIDDSTSINAIAVDAWGNTSEPQKFNYSIRSDTATSSYLEIQVSTAVRASTISNNNRLYLQLTPADKVRLYPRNDSSFASFSTLTGTITVCLVNQQNKAFSVTGTLLTDGGVEFSIPSTMPNGYYQVVAVYSDDGGEKQAPTYMVQQVVEIDASVGGVVSTNGLVAHWSFDDCTAKDISGNGYDGTIFGNPQCVASPHGKAFVFNGNSD